MTITKWREMAINVFVLIYVLSKNKFKKILTAINNAAIIKNKPNKIQKFCVLQIEFFSLKFVVTVFVYSASIISSHLIIELSIIIAEYLPFFQLHVTRFQICIFFTCVMLFALTSKFIVVHFWSELPFLPSNLHLHSHGICFVNIFDSFTPVIILNTPRFKFSILFGIHESLIVINSIITFKTSV